MLNIVSYNNLMYSYQHIGRDINGNPKYAINVFYIIRRKPENVYLNINHKFKSRRVNRNGDINIVSYNPNGDIKSMIDVMLKENKEYV